MSGYDISDTIAGPATALAVSAIGLVRVSGPDAWDIVSRLLEEPIPVIQPRHAYVHDIMIELDRITITEKAVITYWKAPGSYTGEDMVELSVHGNPVLVRGLVAGLLSAGARPAEAGEFTYRAYLNGKLDLVQAEAVHELINAGSTQALVMASTALGGASSECVRGWAGHLTRVLATIEVTHDYAADGLDSSLDETMLVTPDSLSSELSSMVGQLAAAIESSRLSAPVREGITLAICGPPNVGKSTLFNALLGYDRALTSPTAGTTRDYVSETLDSAGMRLTIVDTAGYRHTPDELEAAGIERTGSMAKTADYVLWVTGADIGDEPLPDWINPETCFHVVTHCDRLPAWPDTPKPDTFHVSGLTRRGIDLLWNHLHGITSAMAESAQGSFNRRQTHRLANALEAVSRALDTVNGGLPLDAVASDLYEARRSLHGIYESEDRTDVINQVFSSFCVGK